MNSNVELLRERSGGGDGRRNSDPNAWLSWTDFLAHHFNMVSAVPNY